MKYVGSNYNHQFSNCFGFKGGHAAAKGFNILSRFDGVKLNLGPKCSVPVHAGVIRSFKQTLWVHEIIIWFHFQDTFKLLTPGGGGYGTYGQRDKDTHSNETSPLKFIERGSVHEFRSAQESA